MLSSKLPWELASSKWSAELNPLIVNPFNNVRILENVVLAIGTNIINHGLGKTQQGWSLTDIQGVSDIYRNGNFNSTTLSLHSSAVVTVNIGVF